MYKIYCIFSKHYINIVKIEHMPLHEFTFPSSLNLQTYLISRVTSYTFKKKKYLQISKASLTLCMMPGSASPSFCRNTSSFSSFLIIMFNYFNLISFYKVKDGRTFVTNGSKFSDVRIVVSVLILK